MSDKQERLRETLDALVAQDGIDGAVLVSRDGFCMINRYARLSRPETFSAMAATLVGAAEAALAQAGVGEPRTVMVETDTLKLITIGVSDELVLVVMGSASMTADGLRTAADSAVAGVAKVVAG